MLSSNDRDFLFRAMTMNSCLLFVGAGFSRDAKNRIGTILPDSRELAIAIWKLQGFTEPYDESPLSEVYEAALVSGKPIAGLSQLLEERLLVSEIADWYGIATKPFWYRIYGTNADDVVESAFAQRGGSPMISCINAVKSDYADRDQFLRTIQYVKLNGTLPGKPGDLTFSTREYARRSSQFDRWYDHFVRDYSIHPTVFVGSELREPLFWQAIETRQARGKNSAERPKSFLVAPIVSPAKLPILRELNIVHIPASGRAFFEWLNQEYQFPSRNEVLRLTVPESAEMLSSERLSSNERDALGNFLSAFPRVPQPQSNQSRARSYFLGVAPRWEDLANDFDAPREITELILNVIEDVWDKPGIVSVGVHGPAGSGKTTAMMRLALVLRQSGRHVFFSEGAERPDIGSVVSALENLDARSVLCVDNAHLFGPLLGDLLDKLSNISKPPIVLCAARTNLFDRQLKAIERRSDAKVFQMPDLSDREIEQLLNVMEKHSQLGRLAGMSKSERFGELKERARKQILVAMREATQGFGFDEIIRNEFYEIDNREARTLYLCAAIATSELIDLEKGQWIACAEVGSAESLSILSRNLKGLLYEDERGRISARHALIAEFIVDRVAQRNDIAEAYVRLLSVIAHDIYDGRGRATRTWRLFVRLIDHRRIFARFAENVELARSIYLSVSRVFSEDGHFWLQFANLEIQYGDIRNARPHLAQAESLMPSHSYVLTTRAHLCLREARVAASLEDALALRKQAEEILLGQIESGGRQDEYPYHVYIAQMLRWIERWVDSRDAKKEELSKLVNFAEAALRTHPSSKRLQDIERDTRREYLSLAVSRD